jgi:cell division protein FtsW
MSRTGNQIDRTFLLAVLGMTLFGIVMLTSASGPIAYERFGDSYYFVKHQLFSGVIPGLVAMLVLMRVPYQWYKRIAVPLLMASIVLLSLVFIPGIGTDFGTFANSWIVIGGFSFQPAEVVKVAFVIYLAAWMESRREALKDVRAGLLPFLVLLGVVTILMLLQPDLGTLSIIAAVAFVMYFIAGGPVTHLAGLGALCLGAFVVAVKTSPYRAARFMTFLHPELDPQGIGYQINQALLAVGSGGLFGRGYGHSLQKFQYLPEVVGDSIFAVTAEELGFVFTTFCVVAFCAFLLRGLHIAQHVPDAFGRYVVVGIMAWIGIQAFVNMGAIIGLLPLTGVPLPFLSYGGTALVVSLGAMGIVLNISRSAKV